MKIPLLSIVGTTAVGKTSLALQLADKLLEEKNQDNKKFDQVAIISADSRQVYQGLEVLSGADIPEDFLLKSVSSSSSLRYYQHQKINISLHGVACLKPEEDWSATHFKNLVDLIFQEYSRQGSLALLLVGGTGLYHQVISLPDIQSFTAPIPEVRQKAENMTVEELRLWLLELNSWVLSQMNHSDSNNPRRLIRAIEKNQPNVKKVGSLENNYFQHGYLGLFSDWMQIEKKIEKRIQKRFEQGVVSEVETLYEKYKNLITQDEISRKIPAFSTLGLKEILLFIDGQLTKKECQELWFRKERSYAKRQLTWWKKYSSGKWFEIDHKIDFDQSLKAGLEFFHQ